MHLNFTWKYIWLIIGHLFWECPSPMAFTNHKGQGEHYHEHKHVHIDDQEAYEENGSHI